MISFSIPGDPVAKGLPYWMPPTPGEDINDVWKRDGVFRTSQQIGKWLKGMREEKEWYSG